MKTKLSFNNLDEMLKSPEYEIWESETLLNIQYQIINGDPDLSIDEIIECNDNGLFGHSHREFIECWSEYLDNLKVWESKYDLPQDKPKFDIMRLTYNKIKKEIDNCYKYHTDHFTINDII
ncbi:MAG: hypothetical protein KA807_16390 [Prolixibacteraceae bacterium]|nr:hypothetical protein [Prolixibacteraceae bacterium]